MAQQAAMARREEAVAKRFQNELLGESSWCRQKNSSPTAAELSILGDFELTGIPFGTVSAAQRAAAYHSPVEVMASVHESEREQIEEHRWLAGVIEREGTSLEARI